MLTIPGFTLETKLHQSQHTLIYRGQRVSDGQFVILKTHQANYPGPADLTRLRQDYELGRQVEGANIIRYYDLIKDDQRLIVVQEDFGAVSLKEVLPEYGFNLNDFLDIAIQLTDALTIIHRQRVIHKDLKPGNIVVVPPSAKQEQWEVKVIDFGLATQLSQEMPQFSSPNRLEGTLAYISPEQTGRMNRAIDYRTDFYSLGVIFYQCLSGRRPFESDDPLELVHSHLAREPLPLHQVKPDIPQTVSNIVMKLLAKNAEDRYQSGYGLKADLRKCQTELVEYNQISFFPLGIQDVTDNFQIPQKLYGREQEVAGLLTIFEQVSPSPDREESKGKVKTLMVSGYSGVGKSALVREIHKPVTQKQGYFISGKFEQLARNTPYSAFAQAFNQFCANLLTESQTQLADWRAIILQAVGANGQVLIDVISGLSQVIGPQSPVPSAGPQEMQNRFILVFRNFVKAICRPEHPLVLFIDDLQWADLASLDLLQALLIDDEIQHLLIIGAYRDNEVDTAHPLPTTLNAIEQSGTAIETLKLGNLSLSDVTALLTDTLHNSPGLEALAGLIYEKTRGNAFFTIQFLKSLHEENLLTFQPNEKGGHWIWDIEQIRHQNITDNVVALMAERISKLSIETRNLLELAACLGNQFNLETLVAISQAQAAVSKQASKAVEIKEVTTPFEILEQLWPAVQEGLVLSLDNNYKALLAEGFANFQSDSEDMDIECEFKFAHDRIQQAAYALIEEADRDTLHLQIGRLLLANIEGKKGEADNLFDIVNHYNQAGASRILGSLDTQGGIRGELPPAPPGPPQISDTPNQAERFLTDEVEQVTVASLNLQAGQQAKQAAAYALALTYLQAGVKLLPKTAWHSHYRLMFDLHKELAEAEYLSAHFEAAEALYSLLLQHVQTNTDKLDIYFIQLEQLQVQRRHLEAIEVGKLGLQILGINLPDTDAEIQALFKAEQQALPTHLGRRKISDLIHAPLMTDKKQQRLLRLLSNINSSALFSSNYALLAWAPIKAANISLQYGHTDISAYAYIIYAAHVAAPILQDYETAYQFGRMAINLADKFDNLAVRGRTYNNFVYMVYPWKEHLASGADYFRNAYRFCVEGGSLVGAGYSIYILLINQIIAGHNLSFINEEAQRFLPFLKRTNVALLEGMIKPGALQPLANLLGLTDSVATFDNDDFNEQQFLQMAENAPILQAIFYYAKISSLYWFGNYQAGLQLLDKVGFIITTLQHIPPVAEAYFFMSLTLTAVYNQATEEDQAAYDKTLTEHQTQMQTWADHCPDNFEHKYLLVEAERARISGQFTTAMTLYKQAIASAREYGYLNNEALSNELYARFWLEHDEEEFAGVHMRHAHTLYQKWGATAKVLDLEEKHPRLLAQNLSQTRPTIESSLSLTATATSTPTIARLSLLDLNTVIKASQALSSQISLDTLLTNLIKLAIENAGAQKGFLILKRHGRHFIEATAAIDSETVNVLQAIPLRQSQDLAASIVRYVSRTDETVLRQTLVAEDQFTHDSYIVQQQPKSILCMPIPHREQISGLLYLENNLIYGAFTEDRLELLNILLSQAAISLENARLYAELKQEITDRMQAEKSLRTSEERYRSIFENALIGIYRSTPDGRLLAVNPAFVQMLGYKSAEEVLKLKLSEDIYVDPAQRAERQERFQSQNIFSDVELTLRKKDGTHISVHIEGRIVRDEQGQPLFSEGILQDITKRKQAEEALRAYSERLEEMVEERTRALQTAQEQLIQQEKLAVLGQLADGVAHEVRNPLGVISNAIYFLQMISPDADETTKEYLDLIASRVVETEKIVSALLHFSHSRLPMRGTVAVDRMVTDVLGQNLPPEQVQVTTQIAPDLPMVFVDETQIGNQVLANLVTNAYQAMPEGGELTISARADSDWVRLSVADTGTGMSPETMEKIFEPLFTTRAKGIGLGLAVSRNLVEVNGGTIEVESTEGQGSTFTITLPAANNHFPEKSQPQSQTLGQS